MSQEMPMCVLFDVLLDFAGYADLSERDTSYLLDFFSDAVEEQVLACVDRSFRFHSRKLEKRADAFTRELEEEMDDSAVADLMFGTLMKLAEMLGGRTSKRALHAWITDRGLRARGIQRAVCEALHLLPGIAKQ